MILPALRWLVGAGQALVEAIGAGRRLVRDVRRGVVPMDETDPIPLTAKDSERIAEFGRRAGHETELRPEMRPPPRKSSRYE